MNSQLWIKIICPKWNDFKISTDLFMQKINRAKIPLTVKFMFIMKLKTGALGLPHSSSMKSAWSISNSKSIYIYIYIHYCRFSLYKASTKLYIYIYIHIRLFIVFCILPDPSKSNEIFIIKTISKTKSDLKEWKIEKEWKKINRSKSSSKHMWRKIIFVNSNLRK